jgi:hypothetical protein
VKRSVLVVSIVVCVVAPLTQAATDLFGFTISNPLVSYAGTTLAVSGGTAGHFYTATEDAYFLGSVDFGMGMTISGVTATSAQGAGMFTLTDSDSDTITGNVNGMWSLGGGIATFTGSLSDVHYTPNGTTLNGAFNDSLGNSVSMVFSSPEPWAGGITEITVSGVWFSSEFSASGGSVDAVVSGGTTHAPVPGVLTLVLCGMAGTAGLRKRRSL